MDETFLANFFFMGQGCTMLGGVLFLEGEGLLLRRGSVGYYRITVRSATRHSLSSSFVSTNYRYFRYYIVRCA